MRKQIEFSKTIARPPGAGVVAGGGADNTSGGVRGGGGGGAGGGGGSSGGGARYLQVRGRFTSGGQAGTDRAERRWRGYERKIKEDAGGKLERRRGARRKARGINDDDTGAMGTNNRAIRGLNTIVGKRTREPIGQLTRRSDTPRGEVHLRVRPSANPSGRPHTYGNAYTSTLVDGAFRALRARKTKRLLSFSFSDIPARLGRSPPVHRVRTLLHSHQRQPSGLVLLPTSMYEGL